MRALEKSKKKTKLRTLGSTGYVPVDARCGLMRGHIHHDDDIIEQVGLDGLNVQHVGLDGLCVSGCPVRPDERPHSP